MANLKSFTRKEAMELMLEALQARKERLDSKILEISSKCWPNAVAKVKLKFASCVMEALKASLNQYGLDARAEFINILVNEALYSLGEEIKDKQPALLQTFLNWLADHNLSGQLSDLLAVNRSYDPNDCCFWCGQVYSLHPSKNQYACDYFWRPTA
jgi:hypothetical protein